MEPSAELVDEEDVVLALHHLRDDLLHALLELAAVLGAGDERGDVQGPDLLAAQDVRHVAGRDELREALDDGRLADARVAQDERVVLLAAGKHLHHALDLAVAADDGVELAVRRQLREVAAELLQHGAVVGGRAALRRARAHELRAEADLGRGGGGLALLALALHQLVHGVAHGVARHAHARERGHGAAVALRDDAQEQVLGGDVGLAAGHGLAVRVLQHALGARRERDVAAGNGLGLLGRDLLDGGHGLVVRDVELRERLRGDAVALADEREQQVLRTHVHLAEAAGLLLREAHDLAGLVCELLEHAGSDASNPCASAAPRACGPTDVGLLVRLYPVVRRL